MNQKLIKVEALQEGYKTPKSKYLDGESTKTTQFMLPSILNANNALFLKYFKNAYLTDREHKHNYDRPIFVLFSIKDYKEEDWKKVYFTLIKSKNYITEYDIGIQDNKFLLMIVFQVPKEFEKDYNNFRLGRYSLFSEEYKKKFPEFLEIDKNKKKKNILWQIINKDEELVRKIAKDFNVSEDLLKDEVWEIPRKEREFFRFKIKKDD